MLDVDSRSNLYSNTILFCFINNLSSYKQILSCKDKFFSFLALSHQEFWLKAHIWLYYLKDLQFFQKMETVMQWSSFWIRTHDNFILLRIKMNSVVSGSSSFGIEKYLKENYCTVCIFIFTKYLEKKLHSALKLITFTGFINLFCNLFRVDGKALDVKFYLYRKLILRF